MNDAGLHLKVEFEARPPNGLLQDRIDALRQSLSDLGLSTNLSVESHEETQETRDA